MSAGEGLLRLFVDFSDGDRTGSLLPPDDITLFFFFIMPFFLLIMTFFLLIMTFFLFVFFLDILEVACPLFLPGFLDQDSSLEVPLPVKLPPFLVLDFMEGLISELVPLPPLFMMDFFMDLDFLEGFFFGVGFIGIGLDGA